MSTHDAREHKPDRVSLADEEGVKHVLVASILGLWEVVNTASGSPRTSLEHGLMHHRRATSDGYRQCNVREKTPCKAMC